MVLRDTLRSIRPQLVVGDRVLVVADNCVDGTAEIAEQEQAEVLVREDDTRRGKGWALAAGRDCYRADPPEVLVIVDADTTVEPGAIAKVAARASETNRPVQATYLMPPSPGGKLSDGVSAFAWLVRNYVRPLGLHRLGAPCLLTGSGMALPWRLAEAAPLGRSEAGEDNRLSIELALAGSPTTFCPDAVVRGALPTDQKVAVLQRRRWAHSTLDFLTRYVPRLLWRSVTGVRPSLALLALDLAVPPLMMLLGAYGTTLLLLATLSLLGMPLTAPTVAMAAGAFFFFSALLFAWLRYGRQELPPRALLAAPAYFAMHGPHYLSFVLKRRTEWNRTPREANKTAGPHTAVGEAVSAAE